MSSLKYGYEIPQDVLKSVPGRTVHRSEHFTELVQFKYTKNLSQAVNGQHVGLYWRIPDGELWQMVYAEFNLSSGTSVSWTEIEGAILKDFPVNTDGKWSGFASQALDELWADDQIATAANITKSWSASDADIYRDRFNEGERIDLRAKPGAVTTVSDMSVLLRYYRIPTWDTILSKLRGDKLTEADMVKAQYAAANSAFVNLKTPDAW